MTDPKPWDDDGAPDEVRALLAAARAEQPGRAGFERTMLALGASAAVAAGAGEAAGAAGIAAGAGSAKVATGTGLLLVAAKWGGASALAVFAAAGAAHTTGVFDASAAQRSMEARVPGAAPRSVADPSSDRRALASSDELVTPAPPLDVGARLPEGSTARTARASVPSSGAPGLPAEATDPGLDGPATPPREDPHLRAEVRAIDRARSALAAGDARGTLDAVRAYGAEFQERRFEPEALFLQMEAQGRLGDAAGARATAQRLLNRFPGAPQEARARRVLEGAP